MSSLGRRSFFRYRSLNEKRLLNVKVTELLQSKAQEVGDKM